MMRPIFAVAINALRKGLSTRATAAILLVFLAVLLFAAFGGAFDHPADRILVLAATVHGAAWLFTAAAVVLLGATSLSGDIVERTIYSVLTRPVHRAQVVLGKMLGLSLLALILFATMHLLGYGLVRWRGAGLGDKAFAVNRLLYAGGFERQGNEGEAIWHFFGLDREGLVGERIELKLDNIRFQAVKLGDEKKIPTRRFYGSPRVRVTAYRDGKPVGKPQDVRLYRRREREVDFPADAVDPDGRMEIRMKVLTPGYTITPEENRLLLVAGRGGYALNWGMAALIAFFGLLVLVTVGVVCSTFLSPPVAALLAGCLFFAGTQIDFAKEYLAALAKQEQQPPAQQSAEEGDHDHGAFEPPTALERVAIAMQRGVLWTITNLLPNFDLFDDGANAVKRRLAIPGRFLLVRAGWLAFYAGGGLVLALCAFKLREVG